MKKINYQLTEIAEEDAIVGLPEGEGQTQRGTTSGPLGNYPIEMPQLRRDSIMDKATELGVNLNESSEMEIAQANLGNGVEEEIKDVILETE